MRDSGCSCLQDAWLERLHAARAYAIYLHVPFCARKCAYCDFSSSATALDDPLVDAYLDGLRRLLAELRAQGLTKDARTAYVGGGTPTLAGLRLASLVEDVRGVAPQLEELTCEANPDSLTDELLRELPRAGCTRLSLGVQSLDDGELRVLGRIHSAAQARERLEAAVATGLAVSCDLMCATPLQTDASWTETLSGVLETGVGHVSVYPLQLEEGTPLGRRFGGRELSWNDPEVQASRMEKAHVLMRRAGLLRYEVASYARPGARCRHNEAYWSGRAYVGVGTAASSMLTREGYEALRACAPQLPALKDAIARVRLTCTSEPRAIAMARSWADLHFDIELLGEGQAAAEDLMLAMRMVDGAPGALVAHACEAIGAEAVDNALAWCEARRLAVVAQDGVRPTDQGWLLGNLLYERLWDLAPEPVTELVV